MTVFRTEIRDIDGVYPDNVLYSGTVSRVDVEGDVSIKAVSYYHGKVCIWARGCKEVKESIEDELVNLVIK